MLIICMLVARAQAECRHLQPHTHSLTCVCVFITNMFWPSIHNTFTGLSLSRTSAAGKSRIPVSGNFCRQCFIGFRFFLNAFIFVPFFFVRGVLFGSCVYGFNISWSLWYICTCINMLRTICYMVVGRVCALLFALHVENCLTVLPDDEGKRKRTGVVGVLVVVQRVGGGGSMSWAKTNYVRAQGRSSGQVRVLLAVATRLRRSTRHPSTSFTHCHCSQLYCKTSGLLATRRPH